MKILSITAQKPNSTGSGTYLTEIVRSLDVQGHQQAVIAGVYLSDLDSISFPSGVDFYPVFFDEHYPIYGMSDVMPYPSSLYSSMTEADVEAFEARFAPVLKQAVEALDPDIIYCHHLFLLTAIVRRLFPDRLVYGQCHGTDLRQFINCKQLQTLVKPEIMRLDKICCLHHEQYEQIKSQFDIPADKIAIVGCGYNQDLFYPDNRQYSKQGTAEILYAGKLCRAKGVNELLHAVETLPGDYTLTLAGGCQDETTRSIYETIKSDRVTWVGALPQAELAELFRQKDIFVLPSYFEGLCLAVIEALASGMIVICTDLPMREWVDANIPDNSIIYVDMPEMATLDKPVEGGELVLENNLKAAITESMSRLSSERKQPDMSKATWQAVSNLIIG